MKRGVPHIREGWYIWISSQSLLCPGCVCVSASDWVPDNVSEPFLTQRFTKLQETQLEVCLWCFYELLQIKWLMQLYFFFWVGGGLCFSLNVNGGNLTFASVPLPVRRARTLAVRATVPAEFRRLCSDSHLENNEQQIWRVSKSFFGICGNDWTPQPGWILRGWENPR